MNLALSGAYSHYLHAIVRTYQEYNSRCFEGNEVHIIILVQHSQARIPPYRHCRSSYSNGNESVALQQIGGRRSLDPKATAWAIVEGAATFRTASSYRAHNTDQDGEHRSIIDQKLSLRVRGYTSNMTQGSQDGAVLTFRPIWWVCKATAWI